MPEFNPGEERVAIATFPTKPAGLPCTAELWLASDMTKVATSGEIPFTATGEDKSISLPITLPGVEGTYPVHLEVFSNGQRIAIFRGDEDVVIMPAAPLGFSFGAMTAQRRTCPPATAYGIPKLSCVISNPSNQTVTGVVRLMWARFSHTYSQWVNCVGQFASQREDCLLNARCFNNPMSITLNPGQSTTFSYEGYCWLEGWYWELCDPLLMLHYTYYFWLEDEAGNKSPEGIINIP